MNVHFLRLDEGTDRYNEVQRRIQGLCALGLDFEDATVLWFQVERTAHITDVPQNELWHYVHRMIVTGCPLCDIDMRVKKSIGQRLLRRSGAQ